MTLLGKCMSVPLETPESPQCVPLAFTCLYVCTVMSVAYMWYKLQIYIENMLKIIVADSKLKMFNLKRKKERKQKTNFNMIFHLNH
jgi:hypothetical protein